MQAAFHLPPCPSSRCFRSLSCIVLAKCLDRKQRCDTGRTRKQEAGWERKNRTQEEAQIRWLLWCTLGLLRLWVIVCSLLNYRSFRVSDYRTSEGLMRRMKLRWNGKCVCEFLRRKWWMVQVFVFILVKQQCVNLCKFHLTFLPFWCLPDHIHESLFVSGSQLGHWRAGLGLAGMLYLPIPKALISLLVAKVFWRRESGRCRSSLSVPWPPTHRMFYSFFTHNKETKYTS